jgi:diguanylate cyclase (GGDEF)-like protein
MGVERRLSGVLSEFARTLGTDFPIQAILDHLVGRIVEVLPVTAAGVSLISAETDPRYIAASDGSALRFEQLQTELGEGPCIEAYTTGEAVSIPDLRTDDRFPRFAKRALEAGLVAVFTFPLRQDDHQLGALDLYRTSPGDLDDAEMAAAQTLADVAAAYLLNARARADLMEAAERHRENSLHDALTGLPNRTLLVQRLEHAILRCRRSGRSVALLFADLDKFKGVNDAFGHHVGDELLVAVADRLTKLLRPGDTLARLAGDEFVVLCEELDDPDQVDALARRIGVGFSTPFALSGTEVLITASIGIAFAGKGEDVPERVLQDADTAMYQVKRSGGARHGVVDLRELRHTHHRLGLSRDLAGALRRGELRSEYQPIVTTSGGTLAGVEALLRWAHPTHGIISPAVVIPLAEQTGQIADIGRWVLHQACRERARWTENVSTLAGVSPGVSPLRSPEVGLDVAVNVSALQLMGPDYVATVADVLTSTGTDPTSVTLEVTESVFIQDSDRALLVLENLKSLGVLLALDDFGTGYSSLSYLKRFPVDIVKIDRVFISDLPHDSTSRLIVSAVIALAHSLGMRVVAEGVETVEQCEAVLALDCDYYQGYLVSPPRPAADLDALVAEAGRLSPGSLDRLSATAARRVDDPLR